MLELVLSFISALLIVIMAIPSVIRVSYLKHLYDVPDERKSHDKVIPTLGGLAIFAGFTISASLSFPSESVFNFNYLIGSLLIIFFIGIKDDLLVTAPVKKLLGQIIASGILVILGGVRITSMYGFLGVEELAPELSSVLTIFTLIVIMNGFNLIDGINWLCSGVSVVVSSFLGAWFIYNGFYGLGVIATSLIGAIVGFMWFNKTPAKIFMGDTGSLILGLIIGFMSIYFIQLNPIATKKAVNSVPVLTFGILIVPLFDTLRVFTMRALKGRSPLHPDRNHIHHRLLDLGWSHMTASMVIITFNILFILMVYFLRNIGSIPLLLLELSIASIFTLIPSLVLRRRNSSKQLRIVRDHDLPKKAI